MGDGRTRAKQEPAAIVGMGCVFPGAASLDAFWENICAGVDALGEVPAGRLDPVYHQPAPATGPPDGVEPANGTLAADRFYCRRGGFVDDLATIDPTAYGIMPVTVAGGEPDQFLALGQAAAALADCGNPHDRTASDRVGVIVGRGGYQTPGVARLAQRVATAQQLVEALRALLPDLGDERLQQVREEFVEQLGPDQPEAAIGLVPNLVASRIANRLDLQGPAYTVDAACASALVAVDHAVRELTSRRCDLVLAGGVHHCHDVTLWSVFTQLGALSRSSRIRPFDRRADGTLVGEGSGFVVLKRLADAERDGDRVYAVVRGTGVASDGRARSLMNPDAGGQVLAMQRAWEAAGREPATVGLVEAHGAGTPVGDEVELEGLRQVFGKVDDHPSRAGLGSVKSMIGHAMPAAGAAGLIKAALAVHEGVLPPTLHADEPHPLLASTRFRLVPQTEPWPSADRSPDLPRRAGVSAFGFGGINAHVVLEQHTGSPAPARRRPKPGRSRAARARRTEPVATPRTLLLAGDDSGTIAEQLRATTLSQELRSPEPEAAGTEVGPARLAVLDVSERRLELARRVVSQGQPWRGRDGVWFEPEGLLSGGGKLALLFPGVEPAFEPRVDDVAQHFGLEALAAPALGQQPASGAPVDLHQRARGIIAVGRLFHRVLAELGVEPDMLAGHSIGEWAGELAAGIVAEGDFDALVDQLAPGSIEVADLGFLATGCGIDRARELAAGLRGTSVSHDNCPHQTVLCGPHDELAVVAGRCRERRILAQELPFRSGFHSPLLSEHLPAINEALGSLPMHPPKVPLWSATTCRPYPEDPAAIRALATRHLIEPVRFREVLQAMHAAGARVFVQMGPGGLCGFVDDTLRGREAVALPTSTPRRAGMQQLHTLAAALWVEGQELALHRLLDARTENGPGSSERREPSAPPGGRVRLDLGTRLVRQLTPLHGTGRREGAQRPAPAPGSHLAQERIFALVDEPAWADHALIRQAEGWPHPEDRFPLVPMTGIVEVLIEAARELLPGMVPVAVEDVTAFRWLTVEPPAKATVRAACEDVAGDGAPGADHAVRVKTAIDGHARATVVMAPGYPCAPAASTIPLTGERLSPLSAAEFYRDRHMFHGPAYQGVRELLSVARNGSRARLTSLPAPGALLDAAGQLMGHWLAAREGPGTGTAANRLVLPTAIDRIELYGPTPPPGTELDCTLLVTGGETSMGDGSRASAVSCDLTLALGGHLWAKVTGWWDRCFPTDEAMFRTFQWPEHNGMSTPLSGGVVLVRERWSDSATRDLVMRRYLERDERREYEGLNPLAQRHFLLGRMAVKDAVRTWLWGSGTGPVFPAEVVVREDRQGQQQLQEPWRVTVQDSWRVTVEGPWPEELQVSLAQVDDLAVAVASAPGEAMASAAEETVASAAGEVSVAGTPGTGIDVERIEPRRPNFEEVALTPGERALDVPERFDRDTWLTCLWAVKEAAAKAAGHGLHGRPQDVEIVGHDGNVARVGTRRIAFRKLAAGEGGGPDRPPGTDPPGSSPQNKEYIVAWSIVE